MGSRLQEGEDNGELDEAQQEAARKLREEAERSTFARGYAKGQREAWAQWEERGTSSPSTDEAAALHAAAASAYGR